MILCPCDFCIIIHETGRKVKRNLPPGRFSLRFRKDGRQLRIPAYHSEVYLSDTEGTERGVRTPCPVVYMQENGQFYLDKALAELFK